MAIISNNPRGFAGLIGLNSLGENPRNLAEVIAPTVEMSEWFLISSREVREAGVLSVNGVATYSFPEFEVPVGEIWYVHYAGITGIADVPAGVTCRLSPGVLLTVGSSMIPLDAPVLEYTAGDRVRQAYPGGLYLTAGNRLAFFANRFTGVGSFNVIGFAMITRLEQ